MRAPKPTASPDPILTTVAPPASLCSSLCRVPCARCSRIAYSVKQIPDAQGHVHSNEKRKNTLSRFAVLNEARRSPLFLAVRRRTSLPHVSSGVLPVYHLQRPSRQQGGRGGYNSKPQYSSSSASIPQQGGRKAEHAGLRIDFWWFSFRGCWCFFSAAGSSRAGRLRWVLLFFCSRQGSCLHGTSSHGSPGTTTSAATTASKTLYGAQQQTGSSSGAGAGVSGSGGPGGMGGGMQQGQQAAPQQAPPPQQQQQGYAPTPPGMPAQVGYQYTPSGQAYGSIYYGQQGPVQSNPYQYGYPPHQYPPSASQYQQGGGGQRFPNMPRGYPATEYGSQGMGMGYGQMDYAASSQYGVPPNGNAYMGDVSKEQYGDFGQDQFGMPQQMPGQG
ncbi:unnamed protein product, partial [Scytosiphon promiscuus]